MPSTRRRRIVRRAVTPLAVVVLLVSGYVGSFLGTEWLVGRGVIKPGTMLPLQETIYAPLWLYIQSSLPGSELLHQALNSAYWSGIEHNDDDPK
jgi:hypothetical protein